VTSSFVSAHGQCSFFMSANPARRSQLGSAGKTAAETISVMLAVFARIEPALRKSITFDNDTAFAQHALLRTMRAMTTWFCELSMEYQGHCCVCSVIQLAAALIRRHLKTAAGRSHRQSDRCA